MTAGLRYIVTIPPMRHRLPTLFATLLLGCTEERPVKAPIAESVPPTYVEAAIHEVPLTCADPGLRETLGPMSRHSGAEWDAQPVEVAVEGQGSSGWGAAVADFDGNGELDAYLPGHAEDTVFFAVGGTFVRGSDPLPQATSYPTNGAVPIDLEGDGDVDLALVSGGVQALLVNDGTGRFSDRIGPELAPAVFHVSAGDVDADGDLDLIYAVMRDDVVPSASDPTGSSLPPGWPSRLLLNDGTGVFTDGTDRIPADTNIGYPFVVSLVDVDRDLDPDLYIANDHGGVISNRLYRNDGGSFTDISEASGTNIVTNSMGLGIGDVNRDGLPDLAFPGNFETVLLESTDAGTWIRTDQARQLWPDESAERGVGWGTELADLDNDGAEDALVNFGFWASQGESSVNFREQPDALYLWRDGVFEQVAEEWGLADRAASRGLVVADLNDDGWLDVLKRADFEPALLSLSRCGEAAWLRVRLDQLGANRSAVGARVEVTDGTETWTRQVLAGATGLASGAPPEVHFGLGDRDRVDVTVFWPDGEISAFVEVNTRHLLSISRR